MPVKEIEVLLHLHADDTIMESNTSSRLDFHSIQAMMIVARMMDDVASSERERGMRME